MDIASTLQEFEQKVVVPYALIFPADELRKNTNLLLPIVSVQIRIEDWGKYAEQAPKVDGIRSKFDDETEILFGVGQWVIWPFLFAYALALRELGFTDVSHVDAGNALVEGQRQVYRYFGG